MQIRASQINGCAFCLALHWREAEALGERAALEWTEALTKLDGHVIGDDVYARARAQLTERELAHLTLAVATINAWNRFNVAFGTPPERAEAVFVQIHAAKAS